MEQTDDDYCLTCGCDTPQIEYDDICYDCYIKKYPNLDTETEH